MEFSQAYQIRLNEEEIKDLIAKYINEQKEYFVYSHDVILHQKNNKLEALIKDAHKL